MAKSKIEQKKVKALKPRGLSLEERFNKLVDFINDQVQVASIGGDPFRSTFKG